jgi:hypothetical protein
MIRTSSPLARSAAPAEHRRLDDTIPERTGLGPLLIVVEFGGQ